MSASISRIRGDAKKIARCVGYKVFMLQKEFLSENRGSSTGARARLAQLRRLGTPGGGAWFLVGADVFADLPDQHINKRMFKTMWSTMRLYAIHQQSQTAPMAIVYDEGGEYDQENHGLYRSFGWSCRQIERDPDESKGIKSRLAALEAAGLDFRGIEYNTRALITLMRSKAIPVDYYLLARDLYLLQFYSTREGVFIEWGSDYFRNEKENEKKVLSEV